jgi:uncharacterized protein YerC
MEEKHNNPDFMEFKYDPKTCILMVSLEDKTEIAAMLDSGSTYSLISRETVNKSEILRKSKTKKIDVAKRLKIGDGAIMITDETINVDIYIQGTKVNITCYILEDKGAYQLIIGLETLADLGCSIDFSRGLLKIERSTIGVRGTKKIKLMPGIATAVKITARLPHQLRQLDHIMELSKKYSELGTQMCIVNFNTNDAHIILTNPTNKPMFIGTTSILGCLKLKNLCNPWFAIQTNHSDWTSPQNEACFAAKEHKSEPTERPIGFREMTRENLGKFYADNSE